MAPPTLTWDAPADGGSPIAGYRVLLFEGESLVDTLTSTGPTIALTLGAQPRTAYVQALNDAGYSAPLQVSIPSGIQQEHQPFVASGGGALTFTGTSGAPPVVTFAAPQIAATRSGGDIVFTQTSPGAGYIALALLRAGSQIANPITLPMNVADTFTSDRVWSVRARGADGKVALSNEVTVPAYVLPPDPDPTPPTGPVKPVLHISRAANGGLSFSVDRSPNAASPDVSLQYFIAANGSYGLYTSSMPTTANYDPDTFTGNDAVAAYPKWRVYQHVANGDSIISEDVTTPASNAPPPVVTNSHFIQDAVLLSADGVSTYDTLNKVATDNEKLAFSQFAGGGAYRVTWFKFYVPAYSTINLCGVPSRLGFEGQDGSAQDTRVLLFKATSGNVTDDTISGNMTYLGTDDDSGGFNEFLLTVNLNEGWYYAAAGFYSVTGSASVTDQRMAITGLPSYGTSFTANGPLDAGWELVGTSVAQQSGGQLFFPTPTAELGYGAALRRVGAANGSFDISILLGNSQSGGLFMCYADPNNFIGFDGSNLIKRTKSVYTTLGGNLPVAPQQVVRAVFSGGRHLRVTADGVAVYDSDVVAGPATITHTGKAGVWGTAGSVAYDFSIYPAPTTGPSYFTSFTPDGPLDAGWSLINDSQALQSGGGLTFPHNNGVDYGMALRQVGAPGADLDLGYTTGQQAAGGLVFGYVDEANYYALTDYDLYRRVSGTITKIAELNVYQGYNAIRVTTSGDALAIRANGALAYSGVFANRSHTGRAGFWGNTSEVARDFAVYSAGAPASRTYTFDDSSDLAHFVGVDSDLMVQGGRMYATALDEAPGTPGADGNRGLAGYAAWLLRADPSPYSGTRTYTYSATSHINSRGGPLWGFQDQKNYWCVDGNRVFQCSNGSYIEMASAALAPTFSLVLNASGQLRVLNEQGASVYTQEGCSAGRVGMWGDTALSIDTFIIASGS